MTETTSSIRLFIASDHAGFDLKERLKRELASVIDWVDLGPADASRVDYPDFADRLCRQVLETGESGVLICGSGQGMAIRANRHSGIRAALAWNDESARLARAHNDANVLCLGARLLEETRVAGIVRTFAATTFEGGRHQDRVDKLGRPTEC